MKCADHMECPDYNVYNCDNSHDDFKDCFKPEGYVFSRDYAALFALISSGVVIAAFVDSKWRGDSDIPTTRDICKVERRGPHEISIGVRGRQYGGLYVSRGEWGPEVDLFAAQCEAMNLEWIKPQIDRPYRVISGEEKGRK